MIVPVFVYSCRVQDTVESVDPINQTITVEEAKNFINSQKAGARVINGTNKPTRTEYWKDAQVMHFSNDWPVVVVPLSYNYEHRSVFSNGGPESSKKPGKEENKFQTKLFIYKNEKGKLIADIAYIIPTDEDRSVNKKVKGDSFSGRVLVFDQTETRFMGGWNYEKGKAKSRARVYSTKTARLAGIMGDCDILIYSPSNEPNPAQIGTGSTNTPTTQYYDASGTLWTLNQTITLDCGGAAGSGPGNPANSPDLSLGDVTWLLNTFGQGSSGGGGAGGNGGGTSPIQLAMLTDNGIVGYNPIDNFFYAMENEKGITFSFAEKQLIQDNWTTWGWAVNGYVASTGQKPDLSGFTLNINTASEEQMLNAAMRLMVEEENLNLLPPEERRLLGEGTPNWRRNCELYLSDARRATIRAIIHYTYAEAQEDGFSVANAFKHAMFACYHAESFGRQLAEQICEAHEGGSMQLDSRMDRWNNTQGFRYWDTGERDMYRLDYLIFTATTNGELRWIKRNDNKLSPTNE